jgi:hypothetical protein
MRKSIRVGEMEETTKVLPLGEARSVRVETRMSAGELRLGGGAPGLLDARFRTNVESWRPEVNYSLEGSRGLLRIEQPRRRGVSWGRAENKWDIRLTDQVPLEIEARFGAGQADLSLGELDLQGLNIDMGVGDLTLDLAGYSGGGFSGRVKGGIGHGALYLPRDVGVRVTVEGGLGSIDAVGFLVDHRVYTNEAYERSGTKIELRVEAGIGSLELRLR